MASVAKAGVAKAGGGTGGKVEEFPVQLLGVTIIVADPDIQSRAAMDLDHEKDIFEGILSGNVPPPVTVFFDGKNYWLADGFHRHGAYKRAAKADFNRFGQIRAEVRRGSREAAVIFSAGANQKATLRRTSADKKKAIFLLLSIKEWQTKNCTQIKDHTGISLTTIIRHRNEFFASSGIPKPDMIEVVLPDGTRKDRTTNTNKIRVQWNGTQHVYVARICGKARYLCPAKSGMEVAERICREKSTNLGALPATKSMTLNESSNVGQCLSVRSVVTRPLLPHGHGQAYPGLGGMLQGDGFILTFSEFENPSSAINVVGQMMVAKQMVLASGKNLGRMVVLCWPWKASKNILDLGRQLGIEFLTPEEFVASLAPPADPTTDPAPPTEPTP